VIRRNATLVSTLVPAATAALLAAVLLLSVQPAHAAPTDLAAVTCGRYESDLMAPAGSGVTADPIDTAMWLFGFSVARSGERSMFGDSLTAFGFALDAECKRSPGTPLLAAVTSVRSKRDNPMDLTRLSCGTFERRHAALRKSDRESADTLTMWLYGYAVGLTANHVLDAGSLEKFDAALEERCLQNPEDSLFDALSAPNPAVAPPAASNPRPPARPPVKSVHP
jgi:hypothetical protein